jgi:hypothetical protein
MTFGSDTMISTVALKFVVLDPSSGCADADSGRVYRPACAV